MNNDSTIEVRLRLGGRLGYKAWAVSVPISEWIMRDTFKPLDFPSGESALDAIFCTDTVAIQETLRSREELTSILSKALTEALLDLMGAKDTKMGYPTKAIATNKISGEGK